MNSWDSASRMFKLLGHPARLAILAVLRNGEECVCHLEAALGYRQAYISQHLMSLREAGLVQDRREGPNVFYRVVQPAVFQVMDAVQETAPAKVAPAARQARGTACPCPKCQPVTEGTSA